MLSDVIIMGSKFPLAHFHNFIIDTRILEIISCVLFESGNILCIMYNILLTREIRESNCPKVMNKL